MTVTIVDAVRHSLGSGLVPGNPIDNMRAVAALRAAKTLEDHIAIMEAVKQARANHRTWLTITQRRWQRDRRTVTLRSCKIRKARWGHKHSDEAIMRAEYESVATREKYVRCS